MQAWLCGAHVWAIVHGTIGALVHGGLGGPAGAVNPNSSLSNCSHATWASSSGQPAHGPQPHLPAAPPALLASSPTPMLPDHALLMAGSQAQHVPNTPTHQAEANQAESPHVQSPNATQGPSAPQAGIKQSGQSSPTDPPPAVASPAPNHGTTQQQALPDVAPHNTPELVPAAHIDSPSLQALRARLAIMTDAKRPSVLPAQPDNATSKRTLQLETHSDMTAAPTPRRPHAQASTHDRSSTATGAQPGVQPAAQVQLVLPPSDGQPMRFG